MKLKPQLNKENTEKRGSMALQSGVKQKPQLNKELRESMALFFKDFSLLSETQQNITTLYLR